MSTRGRGRDTLLSSRNAQHVALARGSAFPRPAWRDSAAMLRTCVAFTFTEIRKRDTGTRAGAHSRNTTGTCAEAHSAKQRGRANVNFHEYLERYHNWPYRLFQDPADPNAKRELHNAFFSEPACCLDVWLSEPLRQALVGPDDLASPEIAALLRALSCRLARTTNMHLESLLSEIRAAVPFARKAPSAEKVAYLAHLSNLMKHHLASGRSDSRGQWDRSRLLAHDVPVESRRPVAPGTRPDIRWRNLLLARWRELNPLASASDLAARCRELSSEWSGMTLLERASALAALPDASHADEGDMPEQSEDDPTEDLWDCGDRGWPVRPELVTQYAECHAASRTDGVPDAGLANKASRIRRHEIPGLLVQDSGAIPRQRKYHHRFSCTEAHAGLCAHRDSEIYAAALRLAKSLENALDAGKLYKFLKVFDVDRKDGIARCAATHARHRDRDWGCFGDLGAQRLVGTSTLGRCVR